MAGINGDNLESVSTRVVQNNTGRPLPEWATVLARKSDFDRANADTQAQCFHRGCTAA